MSKLYFLSGLPRTGSTLLASILNQHPEIYVSGTSPLMDLLVMTDRSIDSLRDRYVMDNQVQEFNIYQGLLEHFHKHVQKPYVIDKHRGWPRNVTLLRRFVAHPKIVCTLRPIAEIVASYLTLILKNPGEKNFVDRRLMEQNRPLTTENRAMLVWEGYVQDPYQSVIAGLKTDPGSMLCVQYRDIVTHGRDVLERIFDFLEIPFRDVFDFDNIQNRNPEKDEDGWGMPDLHTIRPVLKAISVPPREILGSTLTDYFRQFDLPC